MATPYAKGTFHTGLIAEKNIQGIISKDGLQMNKCFCGHDLYTIKIMLVIQRCVGLRIKESIPSNNSENL